LKHRNNNNKIIERKSRILFSNTPLRLYVAEKSSVLDINIKMYFPNSQNHNTKNLATPLADAIIVESN